MSSDMLVNPDSINLLKLHGVFMAISFGICLPCAAIVSRYGKLRNGWLKAHLTMISIGLISILFAFYFVYQAKGFSSSFSSHILLGVAVLMALFAQIFLGFTAHKSHDPEAKHESVNDRTHALVGKLVLCGGFVNILLGILKIKSLLVATPQDYFASMFQNVLLLNLILLSVMVGSLEYYHGPSSRYFSGNIFAAAFSAGGAKNLFSLPTFERNMAIKRASIDITTMRSLSSPSLNPIETDGSDYSQSPKTPLSPETISLQLATVLDISPRSKEGNLSPFLYRPQWDAGLKKAVPIHEIARVEQHMVQQNVQTRQVAEDVLTRVREQEVIPRIRSNSVTSKTPYIVPSAESSIVASFSSIRQSAIIKSEQSRSGGGIAGDAEFAAAMLTNRTSTTGRLRSRSFAGGGGRPNLTIGTIVKSSEMRPEASIRGGVDTLSVVEAEASFRSVNNRKSSFQSPLERLEIKLIASAGGSLASPISPSGDSVPETPVEDAQ